MLLITGLVLDIVIVFLSKGQCGDGTSYLVGLGIGSVVGATGLVLLFKNPLIFKIIAGILIAPIITYVGVLFMFSINFSTCLH